MGKAKGENQWKKRREEEKEEGGRKGGKREKGGGIVTNIHTLPCGLKGIAGST